MVVVRSARKPLVVVAVVALIALFLAQTVSTLATTAPTYDEVAHLPAGYAELSTGSAYFNPEHPPLAKLIGAVALWPAGGDVKSSIPDWHQLSEWDFGRLFLFGRERDPTAIMSRARLGPILVGVMMALVCFVWARALFGDVGGLFALALCVFSPTVLAHARLVTTDVPVAAFGILTTFLVWRWQERPTMKRAIGIGAALGATMAVKFTGVLFVPALLAAVAHARWRRTRAGVAAPSDSLGASALAGMMAAAGLVAIAVVGASYGWPPSIARYVSGATTVGANWTGDHRFYMLGHFSDTGFILYFPLAFVLKTSPAVLVALLALASLPPWRRALTPPDPRHVGAGSVSFLAIPPAVYAVFIVLTAPDIGVRYWLPLYPFLFVALGRVAAELWRAAWGRITVGALLAIHMGAAASAWPDPISYFNGILGCRGARGIRCLDDSNFDWGQDLSRIPSAVDSLRGPADQIRLLYAGSADPGAYLTNWVPMAATEIARPVAALYVVSIDKLNRLNAFYGKAAGMDWFTRFRPVGTVGNTYYVFDFRRGVPGLPAK